MLKWLICLIRQATSSFEQRYGINSIGGIDGISSNISIRIKEAIWHFFLLGIIQELTFCPQIGKYMLMVCCTVVTII